MRRWLIGMTAVMVLVGCGGGKATPQPAISSSSGTNADATATRAAEVAQISTLTAPTATGAATATGVATRAPAATSTTIHSPTPARTATAAPTATPAPVPMKLVASGFGQDKTSVGVGFVVQNPESAKLLENTQFQIALYDASDTVLKTSSGYIDVALPGQTLGVGRNLSVAEGQKVAKADVQIKAGRVSDKQFPPAFTTDKAFLQPGTYSNRVSGVVKSTASQDVQKVEIDAVLYDDAGKIIGGGYDYIDFIPANSQAAKDFSVVYAGKPTKIDLSAHLTSLS